MFYFVPSLHQTTVPRYSFAGAHDPFLGEYPVNGPVFVPNNTDPWREAIHEHVAALSELLEANDEYYPKANPFHYRGRRESEFSRCSHQWDARRQDLEILHAAYRRQQWMNEQVRLRDYRNHLARSSGMCTCNHGDAERVPNIRSFREYPSLHVAISRPSAPQRVCTGRAHPLCNKRGLDFMGQIRREGHSSSRNQSCGAETCFGLALGPELVPRTNPTPPNATAPPTTPIKKCDKPTHPSNEPTSKPAQFAAPGNKPEEHRSNLPALLETLFKEFVSIKDEKTAPVKPASQPTQPRAPSPVSSLKEQLEARLYSDLHAEMRDTIQAVLASLVSTSSSNITKETIPESSADVKGKGKAGETPSELPVVDGSPRNIASALEAIHKIQASFFVLESDFVFPDTLDVNNKEVSASVPITGDADTSSVASLESRLSYSSRNAPVRYYLHALTALLAQLDAIESHGSGVVRERRKEVVDRVESALEDVERKVEARLAKVTTTLPVAEARQVQENDGTSNNAASVEIASATDPLPIVIKSPVVADVTKTNPAPKQDVDDIPTTLVNVSQASSTEEEVTETKSSAGISDVVAISGEGTQARSTPAIVTDDISTNPAEDDFNFDADSATIALADDPDDLSSSQTTDVTITHADLIDISDGTSSTAAANSDITSDSEQDDLPPYLLRASDEPVSLSKAVQKDAEVDGDLVVVDDIAAQDANSDWSEVEA